MQELGSHEISLIQSLTRLFTAGAAYLEKQVNAVSPAAEAPAPVKERKPRTLKEKAPEAAPAAPPAGGPEATIGADQEVRNLATLYVKKFGADKPSADQDAPGAARLRKIINGEFGAKVMAEIPARLKPDFLKRMTEEIDAADKAARTPAAPKDDLLGV